MQYSIEGTAIMLKLIKKRVKEIRTELSDLTIDSQKATRIGKLLNDLEEDARLKERIDKVFREQKADKEKKEFKEQNSLSDALLKATPILLAKLEERNNWKEKIRLSGDGNDNVFMDAILDYLETLSDDNRRIEACNNIIKICRNRSVELQKVVIAQNDCSVC
jgi:hypothetical protein